MPQGNMKRKVNVPNGSQKQKHKKKPMGPKKGGMTIAPKKAKKIEEAKMKKNFTKILGAKIEKEILQKAGGLEAKSFQVMKADSSKT